MLRPGRNKSLGIFCVLCALILATATILEAQSDPTKSLCSDRYSERDGAVEDIVANFPRDAALVSHWAASDDARLRIGALEVLMRIGSAADIPLLERRWASESDRLVKSMLATAIITVCHRSDVVVNAGPSGFASADDPTLGNAATTFVRSEIRKLARSGTEWSHYGVLSRFYCLGLVAAPALASLIDDEAADESMRALAAIAFGRVQCTNEWVSGDGRISEAFSHRLDECGDSVKSALLYGLAARSVESSAVAEFIADYVRNDAFSEEHIEAGLHVLRTLPDDALTGARDAVVDAMREYLRYGHSERVIFNAANLLLRLGDQDSALATEDLLSNGELYANYWVLDAVMTVLNELPRGESKPLIERVLTTALGGKIPQVRALAAWHWRSWCGSLPPSLDVPSMLESVRASAAVTYSTELDADCYAQRSAAEVLALWRDDAAIPLFKEWLSHPHEAVRMAAAMNAGRAGFSVLADDLATLASKPCEYSAFGAAWGLMQLGDRRALPVFAGLLSSGNITLARPCLYNLESMSGLEAGRTRPRSLRDWRAQAAEWRDRVKKSESTSTESRPADR